MIGEIEGHTRGGVDQRVFQVDHRIAALEFGDRLGRVLVGVMKIGKEVVKSVWKYTKRSTRRHRC